MALLNFIERRPFLSFLCIFLCLLFFVFKEYIFLHKLYLFGGAAGDSITYSYPHFIHDSEYLKNIGIPKWSFALGMGQNIFPVSVTDPFSLLLSSISKENLHYAIAYIELLKIFLIGVFSFLYLRELKVTPFTTIAGGLLFAFSGYTLLHGGWYYVFSAHAVYIVFLLFAFEKLFKSGKWYWFPIPVALVACLSPFYFLLDCEFLLIYAILRYSEEREWKLKGVTQFVSSLSLLGLLGILISAVCLSSGVLLLLESPRVSGNLAQSENIISNPIFQLETFDDFMISALRMFSTDIFGASADSPFKSDPRYLERNIGYCGLVTLLLVPQIFYFLDKRKKIIYGCILSFFLLGFIFPYFRHLFWFFSGDYYRVFSYFFAIILLYYSLQAINQIDKQSRINKFSLGITLIILLCTLHYKYSGNGLYMMIDKGLRQTITYLLCFYAISLYLLTLKKWQPLIKIVLLVAVIGELAYMSRLTISKRITFTSADYNDYTNEAVAYVNSLDKSFFRAAKDYYSGYGPDSDLNTQQYQGYMGTSCYSSFNQPNYLAFLYAMDIDTNLYTAARSQGLNNKYILQTWASVKYYFIKNPQSMQVLVPMGYDSINQVGDVKILRNKLSLPLGFTYKKYITEDEFTGANFLQKNKILVNAFVIGNEEKAKYAGFSPITSGSFSADNISLEEYLNPLKELRGDTLALSNYTQNSFNGTINLKEKRMLFFSIPFDKGWKATVNGQEQVLEKVNIGFMGLLLDKGSYEIHLEYEPPLVKTGLWVSCIGILLYVFLLWKFRTISVVPIIIEEKKAPVKIDKVIRKKRKSN